MTVNQEIADGWIAFNEDLEGSVPCLYADVKNIITTAMGCIADTGVHSTRPPESVYGYGWTQPNGEPSTRAQILTAWQVVKNNPKCATKGWTYAAALPGNEPRLSQEDQERLIFNRLNGHDAVFEKHFSDWHDRPVAAQWACHSMAWAAGAVGVTEGFPKFCKHFEAGDYEAAATECRTKYKNAEGKWTEKGTMQHRNDLNAALLKHAAGEVG